MTEINMKSLKVNRMTKEEVDKVFEYASKEILDGYMFMHHDKGYLYFKHKITRILSQARKSIIRFFTPVSKTD